MFRACPAGQCRSCCLIHQLRTGRSAARPSKRRRRTRPEPLRSPREEALVHERPVHLEYLDPIVAAVAHVDQPVGRKADAVHRRAELLRDRRIRIVWTEVRVVGFMAVGAPMPLVLSGIRVVHDHPPVSVAIRDIGFVGRRIDLDIRRLVEVLNVVAVLFLIRTTDLKGGICPSA